MRTICSNVGIIAIESADFAGMYPATLAASPVLIMPLSLSPAVSFHVSC
jgi:hypothetical protein